MATSCPTLCDHSGATNYFDTISHAAFFYKRETYNRMILAFIISTNYSKISKKEKAYTKILTSWLSILGLHLIQHRLIIF